jgi:hypothetical protein
VRIRQTFAGIVAYTYGRPEDEGQHKSFWRPMNRAVHAHLSSLVLADGPRPDAPVFLGGGARPNARFQLLRELAGVGPRTSAETGGEEAWELKDLRKTCATYYDAHVPESSVEILGHSVGGITYRHYAPGPRSRSR